MSGPQGGVAAVFDRAADTYDSVGVPWFGPIAQGLVDLLAVSPGERVLDVGCGRGAALLPLAEATGPGGSALGIDLSPRMVELARRGAAHLPQVRVEVADASAPALPPASFDVVSACLVLFFLPDPVGALRAWTELLVPGGRAGVTTFGPQDPRWLALDELFAPHLPPAMLDARTSGRRGPFASDEGVEQLLEQAGLEGVLTRTTTVEAVFRDGEQLLAFTWSHGQRAMWEAVPQADREDLARRLVAAADALRTDGGPLRLTQQVRHTLGHRRGGGPGAR